jgi:ligand-binding sensor domain-containing protein
MKNLRSLILIVLIIFGACQKTDDDFSWKTDSLSWNIKPISNLNTSAIVVDRNNTKWFGTSAGIYKNEGENLKLADVSITGEITSLLYEETNDALWIGTRTGLLKATINGADISGSTSIEPVNLSSPNILSAYLDASRNIWFGTEMGMTLNENENWKNDSFLINIKKKILKMKPVETTGINSISSWDGDYFFATNGRGLYRAKGFNDTIDAFTGATEWLAPYNGENITSTMNVVFVDSKGRQWMGGTSGIQVHTGHEAKDGFTYYNSELADSVIHVITEAPDGTIWVGTEKGLSVFDGTSWTTHNEGLPDLEVTAIAFDKNAVSVWVGTKEGIVNIK